MILDKTVPLSILRVSLAFLALVVFAPGVGVCLAKNLTFLHSAPAVDKIPYPSQNLELVAKIKGTKDTEATMKIVVVRDGRNMEVLAQPGYLDEHDIPTYKTVVPSPEADLSYHFVLTSKDGSIITSPKYFVKRECVPNIELGQSKVPEEVLGSARLQELVTASNNLENDLASYDSVIKLLEEIQKVVK